MIPMYVDWSRSDIEKEWEFLTRELLWEKYGWYDKEENPDGIEIADYPICNKAYPICFSFIPSKDKVFQIYDETICCVLYNKLEDRYYLSLTYETGLNSSQNIAWAYMIVYAGDDENYGIIDWNFLDDVLTSGPCDVSDYKYQKIMKALHQQLKIRMKNNKAKFDKLTGILEEIKERRTA